MANTILIKRGLKADIDKLTLLSGELGIALDTQELYVGDQNGNKQIIKAAANGTVDTAGKLAIERAIGISGDASGSANFDGSKDIEIALTLANSGVTAGTYSKVTVDAKGRVTKGEALTIGDLPTITITDVQNLETSLNAKVNKTDYNAAMTDINSNFDTLEAEVAKKANSTDVYDKATVDSKIDAKDSLPAQAGNSGKFLTTNGTTASWANVDLSSKADKDSVYTKTEVNTELAKKVDNTTYNTKVEALEASIATKATSATTLAGYGIGDAYTKIEVDGMVAGTFHFRGEVDSYSALPTNAKEGDVWQVGDKEYAWDGDSWVELGFNIDLSAYAKTADVANTYATKQSLTDAQTTLQNSINTKANSADVYTQTEINNKLNAKTDKTTTDALTTRVSTNETNISNLTTTVGKKADKATTLAGYGIADAYTKTEIDGKVTTLQNSINTKLDANSTIDGGTF